MSIDTDKKIEPSTTTCATPWEVSTSFRIFGHEAGVRPGMLEAFKVAEPPLGMACVVRRPLWRLAARGERSQAAAPGWLKLEGRDSRST